MQEWDKFVLKSKYQPTGDQPKAIKELVESIRAGHKEQTLLGVRAAAKRLPCERHCGIESSHACFGTQQNACRAALQRVPRVFSG